MEKPAETVTIETTVPTYSWYALSLLTLVFLLNFLDRSLIYILFPPIKKEMMLTDLQLALLGTTSFVIFYTLLGIPFGRLADRVVRKNLIAIGLAVWSLFSGLTGFATDFWTIFACRIMVGVGEATLGPAAFSLLSDYFPARMRATVQAIYTAGIPLGAGVAFLLGGYLGQEWGWRWAFYVLSFPGIFIAVLVILLREPPRGQTEVKHAISENGQEASWRILLRSIPLRYHHLGYALFAMASNSLSIWGPSFFDRVHGMKLASIGLLAGVLTVGAGMPGAILGGYFSDRFRAKSRGGRMMVTSVGALLCVPFWLMLLLSDNKALLFIASFLLMSTALIWLGPAAADVHEIAGTKLRGIAIGIYLFIVNIIGYGIGPPIVGRLNDLFGVDQNAAQMKYSLLICPIACLFSAVLLWLGSRKLSNEKED